MFPKLMNPAYVVLAVVFLLLMALVPYRNGLETKEGENDRIASRKIYQFNKQMQDGCNHETSEGNKCSKLEKFLNIVIAAAINGAIVALDGDTGELIWQYNDKPLLQGTLSASGPIEVGGTSLQLIPTLDGRLYSYAHQSNLIEPLPITTESLLESSVRLGHDAVAGGKSVTTTGINVVTGEISYKCSLDSCEKQKKTSEYPSYPILLVKRISNSIRAMDSLKGTERWNLTTAELELSLAGIGLKDASVPNVKFLLRPPEGVITAIDRYGNEIWTCKLDGHIVNVWHVCGNSIREVSLFDPKNMYTTQYEVDQRNNHNMPAQSSLFYMGTSEGYPFIIRSPKSKQKLKMVKMRDFHSTLKKEKEPGGQSANVVVRTNSFKVGESALLVVLRKAFEKSYSKMIEDKLITQKSVNRGKLTIVASNESEESFRTRKTLGVALIGTENLRSTSLRHDGDYGYLVLDSESSALFSLPSALSGRIIEHLSNFTRYFLGLIFSGLAGAFYTFRQLKLRYPGRFKKTIESTKSFEQIGYSDSSDEIRSRSEVDSKLLAIENVANNSLAAETTRNKNIDDRKAKNDYPRSRRTSEEFYSSRFAEDFEVEKVIGYGGFGVVFRAKCIADANEYAVKRIAVADNEKARMRVLREARALAKFDHQGIIRYFHCWEERPPKGFQEKEDDDLLKKIKNEKLRRLRESKARKRMLSNVKSAESESTAMSFEMPPVVGNTLESDWSTDAEPQKIERRRTTSESKRGLAASGSVSASINHNFNGTSNIEEIDNNNEISSWSTSSSESSSSSDDNVQNNAVESSSDGIEFVGTNISEDEMKVMKKISEIRQEMSLQNRAMIVEDENEELELRRTSVSGDCAYLYIVMQLCEERTLEDWMRKNKSKESRELKIMKKWIKQLAEALGYLHEKGFIHRDLKPGNIFFSLESKPNNKILKIGDLGLATRTETEKSLKVKKESAPIQPSMKHTKNVGTRSYMSPEQLTHQRYTEKVDIFALGLVSTELIIPFATSMERLDTFSAFQKGVVPSILEEYQEAKEFLMQLTSSDISKRPSAEEIVNHPFLN